MSFEKPQTHAKPNRRDAQTATFQGHLQYLYISIFCSVAIISRKKRCTDRSIKVFMTMDQQANGPIRLRNKWLVSGSATIELEPVGGRRKKLVLVRNSAESKTPPQKAKII